MSLGDLSMAPTSSTSLAASSSPLTTSTPSPPTPPTTDSNFVFPPHYSFPPFFTLQPNLTTRASQLASWSALIQYYCKHHRLFSLMPTDALDTAIFRNAKLNRQLSPRDVHAVLSYMASAEGGRRAEWADQPPSSKSATKGAELGALGKVWIYWRRPEDWAEMLERWVDATGQKGTVLTLYELTESDAVRSEEWVGMEGEMLRKSLAVLVKRGRAQVFGTGDDLGVKFF